MKYGCIGEKLGHSFSAEIHAMLTEESYELCEVERTELPSFLTQRDFCGINVTIPYKKDVIPFLSGLDPLAGEIGAVNTIVNRGGNLYGYNTDFDGMRKLLLRLKTDWKVRKVAVLGTGGTSLTAVAVAKSLGASDILRVSRSGHDGAVTYETLRKEHRDVQVLINTTPCGMYPHQEALPVDPGAFPVLECVADAVYHPLRTRLVLEARKLGIPAEGGLLMLVAQAVRASEIFLNRTYPEDTVESVWRKLVRKKENIVLIGMPGSGKTTVGRLLAAGMNRTFCDTDEMIQSKTGKTPAQIIREDGENAFREIEVRVIGEVSMRTGMIIATGGGAVLRRENADALRQNGRIYLLDRPWQKLVPTSDRPLSATPESLFRRYEERREFYAQAADVTVTDPASAEDAAERIGKDFETL